ncbi:MAG TPA: methyltransferase domain-containing protein [Candidatus Omnitrophota bacterium]|nr:methyltransferase domain-containing protein [Candidatus Omnitrophota bacterium]
MLDFLLIFVVIFLLLFAVWISSCFFGAPFQPISNKALKNMFRLAKVKKGDRIIDLGSGNGKIVIEFAKHGAEAHGYEINPLLVWISRRRIKNLGLQKKAFIHYGNFFNAPLGKFDIITSFQINYVMPDLEKKLQKELKKGAKVISDTWEFPNWKPKKKLSYGSGNVYLYVK